MEINRYKSCDDVVASACIKRHIDWLTTEIRDEDEYIDRQIKVMQLWRKKATLLEKVKGNAPMTRVMLLTILQEFGTLNRHKIGVLVGVCPYSYDSGKGKRSI